jgi:hypothetical protein
VTAARRVRSPFGGRERRLGESDRLRGIAEPGVLGGGEHPGAVVGGESHAGIQRERLAIVSWPARWTGGQRCNGACTLLDLTRTLAELGGAAASEK